MIWMLGVWGFKVGSGGVWFMLVWVLVWFVDLYSGFVIAVIWIWFWCCFAGWFYWLVVLIGGYCLVVMVLFCVCGLFSWLGYSVLVF